VSAGELVYVELRRSTMLDSRIQWVTYPGDVSFLNSDLLCVDTTHHTSSSQPYLMSSSSASMVRMV